VLTGRLWLEELLAGHDLRFYNELGKNKFVFKQLLLTLETDAWLYGTCHVSAAEQLAVFYTMHVGGYPIGHCKSNFSAAETLSASK
jgi:hypothetical protein